MNKLVVSLFDLTGAALQPWYDSGYAVLQIDQQLPEGLVENDLSKPNWFKCGAILHNAEDAIGIIEVVRASSFTGLEVVFISCFPPCTDLAVSGSRWFKAKAEENPAFQEEAMNLVFLSHDVVKHYDVAGYIENPVSVISSKWRKPDYKFHPYFFTGICLDDNYTKKTCIWASDEFVMPESDIHQNVKTAIDKVVEVMGKFVPKPKLFEQAELIDGGYVRSVHVYPEEMLFTVSELDFLKKWYPDDRIHKAGPSDTRANFRSATPVGWSIAVKRANS